jgi:hypothetical protein
MYIEKYKKTLQENYGVDNYFQTEAKAKQVPMNLFMAMWAWKLSNDDVTLRLESQIYSIDFELNSK